MPEPIRILGLVAGLPSSLIILAMGLGEVTQATARSWTMFIIGGALFLLTMPLAFGSPRRS